MALRKRRPRHRGATGVLICEDRLIATLCRKGALRTAVVATHVVPYQPGKMREALEALEGLGALGSRVVFGLDACRSFFLVQSVAPTDAELPQDDLLNLQLGGGETGLVGSVESIKLPSGLQSLFSGVPRELVREIIHAVEDWPGKRYVMHATVPLLYRAARPRRAQSRGKCEIRVVCSQGRAIAFLGIAGRAIVARHLDVRAGEETRSIASAVQGLRAYASSSFGIQELEGVHLHCTEPGAVIVADVSKLLGTPVQEAPALEFGPELESRLLAETVFRARVREADLLRSMRPLPSMVENVPLVTLVVLGGLILGGGFFIRERVNRAEASKNKFLAEAKADLAHVGVADKDLAGAHEKAEYEVSIAESFIVHRIYWGELLREIPSVLPNSATLLNVDGKDLVHYEEPESANAKKKKKDKTAAPPATTQPRQFTLITQVVLEGDESSPPEAQYVTNALVESKVFKKTFPIISGANVRVQSGLGQRLARIMIICTPPKVGT